MKKYLICCDLDDTLLTFDKKISLKTIRGIRKLYQNGHKFILSSGRPYQGMVHFAKKIGIDELPIASLNGASIVWTNFKENKITKAIVFTIPNKIVVSLCKEVFKFTNACLASSLQNLYLYNKKDLPFWTVHINELVNVYEGRIDKIVKEDILTLSIQIKVEYLEEFKKIISKKKYESLLFFSWGIWGDIASFEVSLKIATKGHALEYLKELWNIDDTATIAFGDGPNDLPMLEAAYEGVTMCNSREEVLKKGKMFTFKTHNENGVIDYLLKKHPGLFKD